MRKKILLIHLFLAAFVAPALLLVATSGGLYLVGVKGQVESTVIVLPEGATLDFSQPDLEADIKQFLDQIGVKHSWQYLKKNSTQVQTRPTSRTYLEFKDTDGVLSLTRNQPDLQKSMIELHKGHGPTTFKSYQKLVAVSLLFIVLSGVWMGLSSPALRRKTLITGGLGLAVFLLLVFS